MAIKERYDTLEACLAALDVLEGKQQRRPIFKRRRGGVKLTREQVKAIKRGRKLLRKDLKAKGIKDKEQFDLIASSFGLYYDKSRLLLWLSWLFHGRGLWALGGAAAALLATTFLYSTMTQMRGHFTINMSDAMFDEGFVLSETADFARATTHLFCEPAMDVPCISITNIPEDIDQYEGQHNENYFAYTFFIRNEGESTVGYDWELITNSESLELSRAVWIMVFEDGQMRFYARADEEGEAQALPAFDDNSRGYIGMPLGELSADPDAQYELMAQRGVVDYYRVIPQPFVSDNIAAAGRRTDMFPGEIHKYTVVMWLEGDDPDCTNDLIGGHLGMEMNMTLIDEGNRSTGQSWLNTLGFA